jgi:hypothetical protein
LLPIGIAVYLIAHMYNTYRIRSTVSKLRTTITKHQKEIKKCSSPKPQVTYKASGSPPHKGTLSSPQRGTKK